MQWVIQTGKEKAVVRDVTTTASDYQSLKLVKQMSSRHISILLAITLKHHNHLEEATHSHTLK